MWNRDEVFMTACVVSFPSVLSLKVTPGYDPGLQ